MTAILPGTAATGTEAVGLPAPKVDTLVIDDVAQLKVLSQPARFAAFEELFATQVPATATQLAAVGRVSPSSMSYHLRELERAGLLRRADPGDDGRERRWEAPAKVYDVVVSAVDDPVDRLALVDTYLRPLRIRIADELGRRAEIGDPGPDSGDTALALGRLLLTAEELTAVQAEITAVWRRYEDRGWDREGAQDGGSDLYVAHYAWSLLREWPPTGTRHGG